MSETNYVTTEPVTTLTVCILIEGRDILLEIFRYDHCRSVHALNETTYLVIYPLGVSAEDVGTAIEKINEWLGKPVVITCNEVNATQLPQVPEHMRHTTGVESIVLNTGLDKI